ncbi:unnamed protein product [Calicophoron daubneyi]|uniref:ABC-type glutathione-S-conjugate transporter n=1 Tax=Calicophoron daubneyi TaxID=300641 RepID=A0AAV2TVI7_CALDB
MNYTPTYLPVLCGNHSVEWALWDRYQVWDTEKPNLTRCLQSTFMEWTPLIFFIVCLPLHLGKLWKRPSRSLSIRTFFRPLYASKQFFMLVLLTEAVLEIIFGFIKITENNYYASDLTKLVSSFVILIVWAVLLLTIHYGYTKSLVTSGTLFLFWLFELAVTTFHLETAIRGGGSQEVSLTTVRFTATLGLFLTHCFADVSKEKEIEWQEPGEETCSRSICPEERASFLSRMFFMWFTGPTLRGFRRPLQFEDLWLLRYKLRSSYILEKAERIWSRMFIRMNHRDPTSLLSGLALPSPKEKSEKKKSDPTIQTPSILLTLLFAFWRPLLIGAIIRLITDALIFLQPVMIGELINFIERADNKTTSDVRPTEGNFEWHGYFYAILFPIIGLIRTVFFHQQFHYAYTIGMNVRSAATGMIYRKALRLSGAARHTATTGEIVNLMSIDAQRLEDACNFLYMAFTAPLLIIVSLVMIFFKLKWAVLAGFLLAVLLIPFNAFIATKTKTIQHRLMKVKDERTKLLEQTLTGIKVLKMYAWEPAFQDAISKLRDKEVRYIRLMAYLNSIISVTSFCAPLFISLASFAVYVFIAADGTLDANQAFVSLSLFNVMAFPLSMLPRLVAMGAQARISLVRIQNFLMLPELQQSCLSDASEPGMNSHELNDLENLSSDSGMAVAIHDATFGWDSRRASLKNFNFSLPKGKLYVVTGPVGCGKSSLLMSLLNEMHRFRGFVEIRGSVAYVPQQAWCLNASVRENILFGRPMDRSFYRKVLRYCCLNDDLEQFPDGDMTEIGERGINLSGGQKQRISLARAVYQQADVFFLDDPLSAVDAHVANRLFKNLIGPKGLLKNATRVLVTHRLINLEEADKIFVLDRTVCTDKMVREHGSNSVECTNNSSLDGCLTKRTSAADDVPCETYISESGTFDELMKKNGPFAVFYKSYCAEQAMESDDLGEPTPARLVQTGSFGDYVAKLDEESVCDSDSLLASSTLSIRQNSISSTKVFGRMIKEEKSEENTISWGVIKAYIQAFGKLPALITTFGFCLFVGSVVASNYWLGLWSQSGSESKNKTTEEKLGLRDYYLGVYGAIGVIQVLCVFSKLIALAYGTARASKYLHLNLLKNILRAPSSFFDTTPSGRIVNRFSRDIDSIDLVIPHQMSIVFITVADVVSSFLLICLSVDYFAICLIPMTILFIGVQRLYIRTGRQLKRIDSVRRSPIYSHFQESLIGAASIRAYRKVQQFTAKANQLIDESQMARYPNIVCFRWLGVVVELLGHVITLITCCLAVALRYDIGPGKAGLAVTFCLRVANSLTFVIRSGSDLETSMVCVERIKEYSETPSEAPWRLPKKKMLESKWPSAGEVVLDHYSTRYRPGLDLVLKSINVRIKGGERVGVVGRTGAGKSSLTLGLFRLIEPADGRILIDGVDIGTIGLHDLRENLTIIPQDPVLFAGTLRFNLDPQAKRGDSELWEALEAAHLTDFVKEQKDGLLFGCAEGGANMSVGQRQLLCLARALLGHKQILILDEATAAVDMKTDELIQETIRTKFVGHTIITIAHRLATVLNYDRILVLKNGSVVEYDTPDHLLANQNSLFYSMAKEANVV